jgi:hypothetical protein
VAVVDPGGRGPVDVSWLLLEPAGALHNDVAVTRERVVVVHGGDGAYVTALDAEGS